MENFRGRGQDEWTAVGCCDPLLRSALRLNCAASDTCRSLYYIVYATCTPVGKFSADVCNVSSTDQNAMCACSRGPAASKSLLTQQQSQQNKLKGVLKLLRRDGHPLHLPSLLWVAISEQKARVLVDE